MLSCNLSKQISLSTNLAITHSMTIKTTDPYTKPRQKSILFILTGSASILSLTIGNSHVTATSQVCENSLKYFK